MRERERERCSHNINILSTKLLYHNLVRYYLSPMRLYFEISLPKYYLPKKIKEIKKKGEKEKNLFTINELKDQRYRYLT
ncbi:hypothetical protein PUN28_011065 [Cardiocondyla obscurior]|uniref:Uncharacterized protein n=1 Tax=Cardiocondyla obscurior TaxID=286306 RepID=A0AAW2FJ08_9HYME